MACSGLAGAHWCVGRSLVDVRALCALSREDARGQTRVGCYDVSSMSSPTPLLDCFRHGDVSREVRLASARGVIAPKAHEQAAILMLLAGDADVEISSAVEHTIASIPRVNLQAFLARADVSPETRAFFAARGVQPGLTPAPMAEDALFDAATAAELAAEEDVAAVDDDKRAETTLQKLQSMSFTDRIKAAMRGTREVRSILIRDSNKLIASSVLSSPKVSESEIAGYAKMGTVSEDVLRTIAMNRAWLKNYSVVLALTKNSKTPLAISLNLLTRLTERDIAGISTDRNVPDPLRIAARRRMALSKT